MALTTEYETPTWRSSMFLISWAQIVGKPVRAPEPTAAAAPFRIARRVGWRSDFLLGRERFVMVSFSSGKRHARRREISNGSKIHQSSVKSGTVETKHPGPSRDPGDRRAGAGVAQSASCPTLREGARGGEQVQ